MSWAPDYRLVVDGVEITPKVRKRLISLTLNDRRGLEADQLQLTLDDADGRLAIPRRGARIEVALGWRGQALTPCGTYLVDSAEHSGAPDQLVIGACAAELGDRSPLKVQRTIGWHDVTVGALVTGIANACRLTPVVAAELADIPITHLDQTNESFANLLTRLAKDHDAMASIKSGRLLVMRLGRGLTASGKPIQPITIERSNGDSHRWRNADRENYTGVCATYWDRDAAKPVEVVEGAEGYLKTLRESYATETLARGAAGAEWRRLQRAGASFTITLARGRPGVLTETPVRLMGWRKPQIDRGWILACADHTLTDSGLTSTLTLEPAID